VAEAPTNLALCDRARGTEEIGVSSHLRGRVEVPKSVPNLSREFQGALGGHLARRFHRAWRHLAHRERTKLTRHVCGMGRRSEVSELLGAWGPRSEVTRRDGGPARGREGRLVGKGSWCCGGTTAWVWVCELSMMGEGKRRLCGSCGNARFMGSQFFALRKAGPRFKFVVLRRRGPGHG